MVGATSPKCLFKYQPFQ